MNEKRITELLQLCQPYLYDDDPPTLPDWITQDLVRMQYKFIPKDELIKGRDEIVSGRDTIYRGVWLEAGFDQRTMYYTEFDDERIPDDTPEMKQKWETYRLDFWKKVDDWVKSTKLTVKDERTVGEKKLDDAIESNDENRIRASAEEIQTNAAYEHVANAIGIPVVGAIAEGANNAINSVGRFFGLLDKNQTVTHLISDKLGIAYDPGEVLKGYTNKREEQYLKMKVDLAQQHNAQLSGLLQEVSAKDNLNRIESFKKN